MGIWDDRIANRKLELNHQAMAVLEYLSGMSPDFAPYKDGHYLYNSSTYAWYNGRERGFSLVVNKDISSVSCKVFVVVESRISDSIVVYTWDSEHGYLNGPTVKDFPEESYTRAIHFKWGDVGEVVNFIYSALTFWFKEEKSKGDDEDASH